MALNEKPHWNFILRVAGIMKDKAGRPGREKGKTRGTGNAFGNTPPYYKQPFLLPGHQLFNKENSMRRHALAIKKEDNVGTAIRDIAAGETAIVGVDDSSLSIPVLQAISLGHTSWRSGRSGKVRTF